MGLLLTTTTCVFYVDPAREKAWEINRKDGVFYGVALGGGHAYVVARQAPYGQDLPGRRAQDNVVLQLDETLQTLQVLQPKTPLRDAHQCAWFDGRLWVMNTAENAVAIWYKERWTEWRPFGEKRHLDNPDTHHLNSICADDGHIALVANKGGGGTVYLFDRYLRTPAGEIEIGGGAHTIWKAGENWKVMASKDGEIRSRGQAPRPISPYLRGYAFDGTHHYVGVSETNARQERATSTARIRIYDKGWTHLKTLAFPGVGMVHDVHVTGGSDRARTSPGAFELDDAAVAKNFPKGTLGVEQP